MGTGATTTFLTRLLPQFIFGTAEAGPNEAARDKTDCRERVKSGELHRPSGNLDLLLKIYHVNLYDRSAQLA